jgi:hypothetical protein
VKYLYDDNGATFGRVLTDRRTGGPQARPKGAPTPCRLCPKIPPGRPPHPSSAVEPTEQHRQAYEFYGECQAVGSFPDDPIVRWCARIFRKAEADAAKADKDRIALEVIGNLFSG